MSPGRGRGVFALRDIPKGTTVDISAVLLFSAAEYEAHPGQRSVLDNYTYRWDRGRYALALGLGSIFNHSRSGGVNCGYVRDFARSTITYVTTRDVRAEREIFISYGDKLWFDADDEFASDSSISDDDDAFLSRCRVCLDSADEG